MFGFVSECFFFLVFSGFSVNLFFTSSLPRVREQGTHFLMVPLSISCALVALLFGFHVFWVIFHMFVGMFKFN